MRFFDGMTQTIPAAAAHGGAQLSVFSNQPFKAPGSTQASQSLVRAKRENRDTQLGHILHSHRNQCGTLMGTFAAAVLIA
jgi:hypothetical protein